MPTTTPPRQDHLRQDNDRILLTRRRRNLAVGLAIGAVCLLFYAVTIVKFGPAILVRPL